MTDNAIDALKRLQLVASDGQLLKGGGGGGISDDMEARVKRLEDDAKELRGDLKALLIDVAVLKERVSHLPTKGWGVTVAITTVTAIGIIVTLAPKLQAALSIHP